MSADSRPADAVSPSRVQFSIGTLLWVMVILSMALAYLRLFGAQASLMGLAVVGIGLVIGAVVGFSAGRLADGLYWSLLGAFFAYLCTLGVIIPHWTLHFAWAFVGAAAGAAAGVQDSGRPLRRMLASGIAGGVVFVVFGVCFFSVIGDFLVDLFVAPIAGALMGAVVEAVAWTERRSPSRHRRNLCAAGLMLAVIAANMLAPRIVAWW